MKKIILKAKKDAAVRRFHPWVFSGAVKSLEAPVADGELVEVRSARDEYLATGHYQDGSICVRIISFEPVPINDAFWHKKLQNAYDYRQRLNLTDNPETNAYRLVHAEGDGLPGLIIDIYDQTAVVQCHSIGMHQDREAIASALLSVYQGRVTAIYDKSKETLPGQYAAGIENGYLHGEEQTRQVLENGLKFSIHWEEGQKTGFFIDQRDNRQLLQKYASDKRVLNAFSYSGGFSVYALAAGAREVHSVDASAKAITWADQNVTLNFNGTDQHRSFSGDALRFLQSVEEPYDVIVIDPPAFAKSLKKRHQAVQGYKRLNALALRKIRPGGILFTFSCSQVVDAELFYHTIVAAALEAGRRLRLMHRLTQPPDHPVNIFHPEGAYLKGLVFEVE
jgi:23S rRNA (cytosine1962-C5)-methyltransferase